MASKIQAINAYRPRIKHGRRAENAEIVELIARSTGLNEGELSQALLELRDTVVFFNRQGRPVKLDGLGTYSPSIDLEGEIKVGHRADVHLKREMNDGDFRGEIENRENIGKTSDELVQMWNDDHPDDPVT